MTDDILKRLRPSNEMPLDAWFVIVEEAADEIERLRAREIELLESVVVIKNSADYHKSQDCMEIQNKIISQRDNAWAEIGRLNAALAQSQMPTKFKRGDRVRKISGSEWQGRVVGEYSTTLTPEGYAVESECHPGSVQIYPVKALQLVGRSSHE